MDVLTLVSSESGGVTIKVAKSTSLSLGVDFGDIVRFVLEGVLVWIVYPRGIVVWDWREDKFGYVNNQALKGKVSTTSYFPSTMAHVLHL